MRTQAFSLLILAATAAACGGQAGPQVGGKAPSVLPDGPLPPPPVPLLGGDQPAAHDDVRQDEPAREVMTCGGAPARVVFATAAEGLSLAGLKVQLAARRFAGVADFVAALPDDVRARRALVYQSKSLQAASPAAPRVLLTSADGGLSFAFESAEGGAEVVELMARRDDGAGFDLYEAKRGDDGFLALSAANPAACARCHGAPARPVWEAYSVWNGVYGGVHGHMHEGSAELSAYRELEAAWTAGKMPRLASLTPEALEPAAFYDKPTEHFATEAVNQFASALGAANAARIVAAARGSAGWEAGKRDFAAAVRGCKLDETALPGWGAAVAAAGARQAAYVDVTTAGASAAGARLSRAFVQAVTFGQAERVGALELVAAKKLGLDAGQWPMTLAPSSMLATPNTFEKDVLAALEAAGEGDLAALSCDQLL